MEVLAQSVVFRRKNIHPRFRAKLDLYMTKKELAAQCMFVRSRLVSITEWLQLAEVQISFVD